MCDDSKIFLPVAFLIIAGFVLASRFANAAPPRHVRFASGSPQGAYAESARRYRGILARDGITLEVVPTTGFMENLKLLQASTGGVDVAVVQGGTASADTPDRLSLGSVFFEFLCVFVRDSVPARHVGDAGATAGVGRRRERHRGPCR